MAISTKPPSGTRDFLPADIARREHVVGIIRRAYALRGFVPLETPTVERVEVLTGKYGEEGDQLIFRVLKRGDKMPELNADTDPGDLADLALRYDLTVPLARVVAAHRNDLPRVFKRYQIQPVWRADRPQRGRYREFYQCDVDYVGTEACLAEAEVIGAVTDALEGLGFDGFTVRLNDRRILDGLMERAGVAADDRGGVLVLIDKLDKIGTDAVVAALRDKGLGDDAIEALRPALTTDDARPDRERLGELRRAFEGVSELGVAGCDRLLELLDLLDADPPKVGVVRFDPTLARGLSYYTGPIYEIAVDGLNGSMGGGGRYDELVGMFRNDRVPAVGFSLGLERLLVVMEDRGMFPELSPGADVLVARLDDDATAWALRVARELRGAGLSTEVFPELAKVGKQLKHADQIGARWAVLVGSREVEAQAVAVKDLRSGEQVTVGVAEAIARIGAPRPESTTA